MRRGTAEGTDSSKDEGQLILYRPPERQGPKESFYLCFPTSVPGTLREILAIAYGETGRVEKQRTLFLVGRARIHLDTTSGLGHFAELEVVLEKGECPETGERKPATSSGRRSRKTRNMQANPRIVIHLDGVENAVMLEGAVESLADRSLLERFALAYEEQYGWAFDPDDPPGIVFAFRPRMCISFREELAGTATRWVF